MPAGRTSTQSSRITAAPSRRQVIYKYNGSQIVVAQKKTYNEVLEMCQKHFSLSPNADISFYTKDLNVCGNEMTRISAMLWNRAVPIRRSVTFNIFIGREPTPDSDGNCLDYSEDESDFYEGEEDDADNKKEEEDQEVRPTVARPPFRTRIEGTITLSIYGDTGAQSSFQVQRSTKIKDVLEVWCHNRGLDPYDVRPRFNGKRIQFYTQDTVGSLGIVDGDYLETAY